MAKSMKKRQGVPKAQPRMQPEGPPMEQPQVDPKLQKEIDAYTVGLSRMLHSKETSADVMNMLESGPPEQTIPQTALVVNGQMEASARQGGKPPSLDVLLNAGVFLVSDLIEMGNAKGIFQIKTEQEVAPILQSTMQTYIEDGLAKGTIDPVELQEKVEPLMSEEHKALGMEAAGRTGIPQAADQSTAMHAYGAQMERKGALSGGKR